MRNMPLRYGLALAVSYPVFFLCVRVWASVMRDVPTADNLSNSDFADYLNTPIDGEGCLVALAAGTMVRRLRHFHVVGNWKVRLLRNTAPFAFAVMVGVVAIAAGLQNRVPGATTFAQACRVLYLRYAHSHSR